MEILCITKWAGCAKWCIRTLTLQGKITDFFIMPAQIKVIRFTELNESRFKVNFWFVDGSELEFTGKDDGKLKTQIINTIL